jgi:invasion protein IalB
MTPAAAAGETASPAGQLGWIKRCQNLKSGKTVCLVAQNMIAVKPRRQRIASLAIREVKGEKKKYALVVLPLGTLLAPGLTLRVDDKEPLRANFTICFAEGCHAQLEASDKLIKHMKAGNVLHLYYVNYARKRVDVQMPLAGFTKSYDGKPVPLPKPAKKKVN